ncbi:PA14 domain-containing protein [Hymenobacter sp. GOD-10R]|uniref:PA14 domain-containing protein n=1 Tax=Hymenobacter sp. GOD-10R TaxID=3093922 RepID=UPI002D7811A5|nr:RICIN domain-containing protein [Hymenobacter sp. GOD-10R]WRQ30328.1 RICIN domain-containing protein [Hymenobacter sp. GOD-10R]
MRHLLFCSILGLGVTNSALADLPVWLGATDPTKTTSGVADPILVQGAGTGLTASYFNNGTLAGAPVLQRVDTAVDFRWGKGAPASTLPADYFSVRWEGLLAAPATGSYTFAVPSDSGVRLWVNGKKVIDTWSSKGTTGIIGVPVSLAAGEKTSIKLEYYEEEGDATVQLMWTPPGKAPQIIPMAYLYPSGSPTTPDPTVSAQPAVAAAATPNGTAAKTPAPAPVVTTEAVAVEVPAMPAPVAKATPAAARPAAPAPKPVAAPAPKAVAAAESKSKDPKPLKPSATAPKLVRAPKPVSAPETTEVLSGVFTLKVRTTGTPLEVIEPSHPYTGEGLAAAAATPTDPQWKIESVGDGYYRVVVQGSNKVLEVLGSETSNGTPMSLWTYYSGNNQLWRIEPVGEGYYKLIAKHSRKALTSKIPTEGGIQQWRYSGREDQQWKLEPATVKPPTMVANNVPGVGANNMSVYPNPSNGVVQMNYQLTESLPLGWVLYDQRGVVVRVSDYRRQTAGPHNQTLDFVALPTGDYNLHLTVGTTTTQQPVVIRHPKSDTSNAEASK